MMWAALGAGLHRSTALRWLDRLCRGDVLAHRRGPCPAPVTEAVCVAASALVRELHGLIGADSLRHSVPGLTRRAAARIKRETCQTVERERRAQTRRVAVVAPGILRGFDAMELCSPGEPRRHALIAADGCVPFRTSWTISPIYDARAVADLLEKDFDLHGAPLVLRFDRAKAHVADVVDELLQAKGVLPLHGPPHYARYYGQLERQNREHRAWLGDHAVEANSASTAWSPSQARCSAVLPFELSVVARVMRRTVQRQDSLGLQRLVDDVRDMGLGAVEAKDERSTVEIEIFLQEVGHGARVVDG